MVFHSVLKSSLFKIPHIITTAIEHDSVLLTLREMKQEGRIGNG